MMTMMMTFNAKIETHRRTAPGGPARRHPPRNRPRSPHPERPVREAVGHPGEPRPRPVGRQPRRLGRSTLPVLANVLLRTEDAGLEADGDEPRDRDHLLGPGQDRRRRRDHRPGTPAHRRRQLAPERADRPRAAWTATASTSRCGRFETHLQGIDADEFPAIPTAGERPTTRISQQVLRRALAEVAFAAATDEARPILTGVLTRFEGDRLTLAAADNYRIAITTIPVPRRRSRRRASSCPARSYNELARVLADTDDPVDIILVRPEEPGPLPPRGDRPRQPAHRRPVPQLPAGPARRRTRRASSSTATSSSRLSGRRRCIASASANIVKLQVAPRRRGAGHRRRPSRTSATTRARSTRRSRATGRRSPSTPATSPTCSRTSRRTGSSIELNGPLSPGVFRPADGRDYMHVVMPVRTTS